LHEPLIRRMAALYNRRRFTGGRGLPLAFETAPEPPMPCIKLGPPGEPHCILAVSSRYADLIPSLNNIWTPHVA
jgi:hypothetical protein